MRGGLAALFCHVYSEHILSYIYLKATCGLFDRMSHNDAHGLVDIVHQSGDVATMELVSTHHLAGIMLRPVDFVLKDGHTIWVLENLVLIGHTRDTNNKTEV